MSGKPFKILLLSVIAMLAVAGGTLFLMRPSEPVDAVEVKTEDQRQVVGKSSRAKVRRAKVVDNRRLVKGKDRHSQKEKPTFELDEEDEARLNAEQKALIEAIRQALDDEKLPVLIKLVSKMQQSDLWPDGFPVAIRKAAIEALGWFGHEAIPEIVGFLGDSNEDILQTAIEAYEMSLMDANGDEELSQLLIAACQAINDADAMDMFMMELNNMRPSRVVSTVEAISKTGTAAAKAALPDAISFYTGEDSYTTVEQLKEWYNDPSGENKDDEDAEEFYGPQKDE